MIEKEGDDEERRFQKRLAWRQMYSSILVTLGAIITAFGGGVFFGVLSTEGPKQTVDVFGMNIPLYTNGFITIIVGLVFIAVAAVIGYIRIKNA